MALSGRNSPSFSAVARLMMGRCASVPSLRSPGPAGLEPASAGGTPVTPAAMLPVTPLARVTVPAFPSYNPASARSRMNAPRNLSPAARCNTSISPAVNLMHSTRPRVSSSRGLPVVVIRLLYHKNPLPAIPYYIFRAAYYNSAFPVLQKPSKVHSSRITCLSFRITFLFLLWREWGASFPARPPTGSFFVAFSVSAGRMIIGIIMYDRLYRIS